jgi:predicted enzyme related to lactoylglutathione lyase
MSAPADLSANDRRIDYVELNVRDIARAKHFYAGAFGWEFTDYGPEYAAFFDGRLNGGLRVGEPKPGGPLVILYGSDLAAMQARVERAGGTVVVEPFAFPGGRRFHFKDLDGYELAVWSDT